MAESSSSDFGAPVKPAAKKPTIQLAPQQLFPVLSDACLIPGVTFTVSEQQKQIISPDEVLDFVQLKLSSGQQLTYGQIEYVVNNLQNIIDKNYSAIDLQKQNLDFLSINKQRNSTKALEIVQQVDELSSKISLNYLHQGDLDQLIECVQKSVQQLEQIEKYLILIHFLGLQEQYSAFQNRQSVKSINQIADFCISLCDKEEQIMDLVEASRNICLLNQFQQQDEKAPSVQIGRLKQILRNQLKVLCKKPINESEDLDIMGKFYKIGQLVTTQEIQNNISIEQLIEHQMSEINLSIGIISKIISCFYYIHRGKSPITMENDFNYLQLKDILILEQQAKIDQKQVISKQLVSQGSSKSQMKQEVLCLEDSWSDSVDSVVNMKNVVENEENIQQLEQDNCSNNNQSENILQTLDQQIEEFIYQIASQPSLIREIIMIIQSFIGIYNISSSDHIITSIDTFQDIKTTQSFLGANITEKMQIVNLPSPFEQLCILLFTFFGQRSLNFKMSQFETNKFILGLEQCSKCLSPLQNGIKFKLIEFIINQNYFKQNISLRICAQSALSDCLFESGQWCKGIISQIQLLLFLRESNENDQCIEVSLQISQQLFAHAEFDYAQQFLCYACQLSSDQDVILDERQHKSRTVQSLKRERSELYQQIQNVDLAQEVQISFSSSSSYSEISDSSSNCITQSLSEQVVKIYLMRAEQYEALQKYNAASQLLSKLLSIDCQRQCLKLQILEKLCQLNLKQRLDIQEEAFERLDLMIKSAIHDEEIQSQNNALIQEGYLIIAQLYFSKGLYCQALAICLSLFYFQTSDDLMKLIISDDLQTKNNKLLILSILQSLLKCNIDDKNQLDFVPDKQQKVSFPNIGSYLLYCIDQCNSNKLENEQFLLLTIEKEQIILNLSILSIQQLYLSLFFDTLNKIDEIRDNGTKQKIILDFTYFLVCNNTKLINFRKISLSSLLINQEEDKSKFMLQFEKADIEINSKFRINFSKDIVRQLPQFNNSIDQCLLLLLYCMLLLQEGKQSTDIEKILKNVTEYLHSSFMIGIQTICGLIDCSYHILVKIRKCFELVVLITSNFDPLPDYFYFFVDALLTIDNNIRNISCHQSRSAEQKVQNKNLKQVFDSYNVSCDKQNPIIQFSQADFTDVIQCKIECNMENVTNFVQQLPSAIQCTKMDNIGFDRASIQLYQLYASNQSQLLDLYLKQFNNNMCNIINNQRNNSHLENSEIQVQHGELIAYRMEKLPIEDILQYSQIFSSQIYNQQYKVQQIINSADVVRASSSLIAQIDFSLPLSDFIHIHYQTLAINKISSLFATNSKLIFVEKSKVKLLQIPNRNVTTQKELDIPSQSINLNGLQYQIKQPIILKVNEIFQLDYLLSNVLSETRQDSKFVKLDEQKFLSNVTHFRNLLGLAPVGSGFSEILQQIQQNDQTSSLPLSQEPNQAKTPISLFKQFVATMCSKIEHHIDIEPITSPKGNICIVTSPSLSILPLDQAYGACTRRFATHFECVQRLKQEQDIEVKRCAALVQLQNYQQLALQNARVSIKSVLQVGEFRVLKSQENPKSSREFQEVKRLFSAVNAVNVPIIAQFYDSTYEQSQIQLCEEKRRNAILASLCNQFETQAADDKTNDESSKVLQKQANSRIEYTKQAAFYSQLLEYGQKEFTFHQKKQFGKGAQIIDSQITFDGLQKVFKNTTYSIMNSLINSDEFHRIKEKTEAFLKENVQSLNVIPEPAPCVPIIMRLRGITTHSTFSLNYTAIPVLTFADLIENVDMVQDLMMMKAPMIVVPCHCVESACELISYVQKYIEKESESERFRGSFIEYLSGDIRLLMSVIGWAVREGMGAPAAVWHV